MSSSRAAARPRDQEHDAADRRPPPTGQPETAVRADQPDAALGPAAELAARGRRAPLAVPGNAGLILGLQRTAGNAYVQRLLGGSARPLPPQPPVPAPDLLPDPGVPLPEPVRAPMEGALGADFSEVRVHTGPDAAASAAALNARAYTAGRDIVFGAGAYAPDTPAGQERLAHELTHVLQQAAGPVAGTDYGGVSVSDPADHHEQEAAHTAARVAAGEPITAPTMATTPAVQRLVRDPAQEGGGNAPAAEPGQADTPAQAAAAGPMSAQATAAATAPEALTGGTTDAERVANDIYRCMAMPNPAAHTEEILQAILLARGRGDAVIAAYQSKFNQNLTDVLDSALAENDAIRARRYLQYGTLRLADKIFFAVRGAGSDEDTLYRLMREARGAFERTESEFITDYGAIYSRDGRLPDGRMSRLAGVLDDELSGADLAKAKAILVYGEPRPADRIRMATAGAGTDEDLLFSALQAANRDTIRQEYQASYEENLDDVLDEELSGDAFERATLTLAGRFDTMARIRYAVEGLGTDEQLIFDTLAKLDEGERAEFLRRFNDHSSEFYQLLSGDLNGDAMDRVAAILQGGATMGSSLRQAGATDGSAIVDTIKMTSGDKYESYRRAYLDNEPDFWGYAGPLLDGEQMRALRLILTGTPEQRLRWAIEGFGTDEDYIFHVLQHFTTDEDRRRIAADSALMDELAADLSTSDMNRVRGLLTPGERTLQERVADVNTRIEREGSWVADAFSNASDALADEQREMNAALTIARADGAISAAEQTEINARLGLTESALDVYISVRDELESTTATILTTAAGILIAVASGGLASGASAAMIAAALAKAAVASAVTRVVVTKIARGDRFDIMGADGAIAFGAGAIDGVMNVVGAGAAQRVVGPLFSTAMRSAAAAGTETAFQTVGRTILLKATEGSLSGAASALFESAANEVTWKGGFEAGVTNVLASTGTAAGMGAGLSVGMHYVAEGLTVAVRGRAPATGGGPDVDLPAGRGEISGEVAGGTSELAVEAIGGPETPVPVGETGRPVRASVNDTPTIPGAPAIDETATLPHEPATVRDAPAVDEAATLPTTPADDTTLVDAPALDETPTLPATPADDTTLVDGTPLSEADTLPGAPATPGPEIVLGGGQTVAGQALPAGRIPARAHPAMANVLFDPRIQGLDIDAVLASLELTPTGARIADIIRTGHAPDGTPVNVRFVRPEDLPGLYGLQDGSDLTIVFDSPDQAARTLVHEGAHFLDPVSVGGVDATYLQMEGIARAFEFEWAEARGIEPSSPAYQAARNAHEQAYMDAIVRRSLAGEDDAAARAGALRDANIAADRAMLAHMRAHPDLYAVESPAQMQQLMDDLRASGGTLDDALATNPAQPAGFLPPESALEESLFGDLYRAQEQAGAATRTDVTPTLPDQPAISDTDLATTVRDSSAESTTDALSTLPAGGGGGGHSSPPDTIPDSGPTSTDGSTIPDSTRPDATELATTRRDSGSGDTTRLDETAIAPTREATTQPLTPAALPAGAAPAARVLDPILIAEDIPITAGANAGKRRLRLLDGRTFIFKPASGEVAISGEQVGIHAGERYRRGAAASETAVEAGIAAPATDVVVYRGEIGQLQEWVEGPNIYMWADLIRGNPGWEQAVQNSQMKKDLDTFDYLIANMDRHAGNLLVEIDPQTSDIVRLIPIDMDAAFPPSDIRYTMGVPDAPHEMPLPDTVSADLEARLRHMDANRDALRRALGAYLTEEEVNGTLARLTEILAEIDNGTILVTR